MKHWLHIFICIMTTLLVSTVAWAQDSNKTYEICEGEILEKTVSDLFPTATSTYNTSSYRFRLKIVPDNTSNCETSCDACESFSQSFCNLNADRSTHSFTVTLTIQRKQGNRWSDIGINKPVITVTVNEYRKPNIKFGANPLN